MTAMDCRRTFYFIDYKVLKSKIALVVLCIFRSIGVDLNDLGLGLLVYFYHFLGQYALWS